VFVFLVVLGQFCFVGKLFFLFTKKKFSTDNTFIRAHSIGLIFFLFSDLFFKENKMKIKKFIQNSTRKVDERSSFR